MLDAAIGAGNKGVNNACSSSCIHIPSGSSYTGILELEARVAWLGAGRDKCSLSDLCRRQGSRFRFFLPFFSFYFTLPPPLNFHFFLLSFILPSCKSSPLLSTLANNPGTILHCPLYVLKVNGRSQWRSPHEPAARRTPDRSYEQLSPVQKRKPVFSVFPQNYSP